LEHHEVLIMILNNVRQHNYIGYMFRLTDQSSSGLFSRLNDILNYNTDHFRKTLWESLSFGIDGSLLCFY